jgi:hypothetical protein
MTHKDLAQRTVDLRDIKDEHEPYDESEWNFKLMEWVV